MEFTAIARRLGLFSAAATVVLLTAYAVTLTIGLLSLESPDQPIRNPMFAILEILIIVMMPAIVALMIAVHAWAPTRLKALSFAAVVFMGLLAGLTSSLHFVILTVSRQPEFARQSWLPLVLEFKWPSIAYTLDILGWDVFFALSMLFAAPVFGGSRLAAWIRWLMAAAGILALTGLSGVAFGDMQLRNIGIVGYVPVFLVVAALLGVLLYRTAPCDISERVPGASELPESTSSGSASPRRHGRPESDRGARFPSMTRLHISAGPRVGRHTSLTRDVLGDLASAGFSLTRWRPPRLTRTPPFAELGLKSETVVALRAGVARWRAQLLDAAGMSAADVLRSFDAPTLSRPEAPGSPSPPRPSERHRPTPPTRVETARHCPCERPAASSSRALIPLSVRLHERALARPSIRSRR